MSVVLTPIDTSSSDSAYLTASGGRDLAAQLTHLSGISDLLALTDDELSGLLYAATLDIDAVNLVGVRAEADQALAFPRIYYPAGAPSCEIPYPNLPGTIGGAVYWDWDSDQSIAVIPDPVKLACLFQATWLADPANTARREAILAGLASQKVGSVAESYATPGSAQGSSGAMSALCDRAARLLDRYRPRSGALI